MNQQVSGTFRWFVRAAYALLLAMAANGCPLKFTHRLRAIDHGF